MNNSNSVSKNTRSEKIAQVDTTIKEEISTNISDESDKNDLSQSKTKEVEDNLTKKKAVPKNKQVAKIKAQVVENEGRIMFNEGKYSIIDKRCRAAYKKRNSDNQVINGLDISLNQGKTNMSKHINYLSLKMRRLKIAMIEGLEVIKNDDINDEHVQELECDKYIFQGQMYDFKKEGQGIRQDIVKNMIQFGKQVTDVLKEGVAVVLDNTKEIKSVKELKECVENKDFLKGMEGIEKVVQGDVAIFGNFFISNRNGKIELMTKDQIFKGNVDWDYSKKSHSQTGIVHSLDSDLKEIVECGEVLFPSNKKKPITLQNGFKQYVENKEVQRWEEGMEKKKVQQAKQWNSNKVKKNEILEQIIECIDIDSEDIPFLKEDKEHKNLQFNPDDQRLKSHLLKANGAKGNELVKMRKEAKAMSDQQSDGGSGLDRKKKIITVISDGFVHFSKNSCLEIDIEDVSSLLHNKKMSLYHL